MKVKTQDESTDNEVFYAVYGIQIGRFYIGKLYNLNRGTSTRVSFVDRLPKINETKDKLLGFYHTHPNFFASPSDQDYKAMNSCVISLGKDLLCAIDGIDGLIGWWYSKKHDAFYHTKIKRIGNFLIGMK